MSRGYLKDSYDKWVNARNESYDEKLRREGYKVTITVEKQNSRPLVIHTSGIKGRVRVDDYEEDKVRNYLGHDLGEIRLALKNGTNWRDSKERIIFEFSKSTHKPSPPANRRNIKSNVFGQRIG